MIITTVLEKMCEKHPDKDAIVCDGKSLTFRQLNEQTHKLSYWLTAMGLEQGDTVGILLPNCIEYPASFIAPLRLGAISVPLNPRYNPNELKSIFKDCNLSALITDDEHLELAKNIVKGLHGFKFMLANYRFGPRFMPVISHCGKTLKSDGFSNLNLEHTEIITTHIHDEDDAVYIYTSGTTGQPKGVIMTHEIIACRGTNARNLEVASDDKCYTVGGLHHNGKLFVGLIWSLYLGMTFYTDSEFHPEQTLKQIASSGISLFHASPFHFAVLANWDGFEKIPEMPYLRLCLSSGNRIDTDIARKFYERFGVRITENYGITEAGGICTDGFPHAEVQIKILDEKGNELGKNMLGEVIVKKTEIAKGYLNHPKLTEKVFKNGWFHTGDIGRIDETGKIHIICRKKFSILVNGRIIYPDEIQGVLKTHPYVQDALIQQYNGYLKAFVVVNKPCFAQSVIEYCQKNLESYKVPHIIEFCQKLPHLWQDAVEKNRFNQFS
ncbi:MAG: acyl--CoA ligase [Desulfobacteraceae bacterium]|nr:acyl--CoA ligase [Desulfobacteraceae bacterium]